MEFTAEERERIEKWFHKIREHAAIVQNSPSWIALEPYKDMHVWRRLYEICAMSDVELREMIAAEHVLFRRHELDDDINVLGGKTYNDLAKGEWDVLKNARMEFVINNLDYFTPDCTMPFDVTADFDEVSIVYLYVRIRKMVATILRDPSLVGLKAGEDTYIWKLLHRWHTLAKDDAMAEIAADYRLFYIW